MTMQMQPHLFWIAIPAVIWHEDIEKAREALEQTIDSPHMRWNLQIGGSRLELEQAGRFLAAVANPILIPSDAITDEIARYVERITE